MGDLAVLECYCATSGGNGNAETVRNIKQDLSWCGDGKETRHNRQDRMLEYALITWSVGVE